MERAAPHLTATWTDDETGARGHVVIDTRIRGVAGGGLRMRPGLTVDEVADLARAMTRKEALAYRPGARYVPLGGAKGGIDFDPRDPRALGVLARFTEAMQPLLERRWAAGEDMGVRQDDLDEIAARLGLRSTVDCVLGLVEDGADAGLARLDAAFAARDRGIGLGELVGGYGVARAALEALARLGIAAAGARVVVQGFGSMGGATARYLADAGLRVVALADIDGVVASEAGLDVETLLRTRDRHGRIDRAALRAGDGTRPSGDWARIPCEVLVPAAASYVIDEGVAAALDARVVVEAANVATLPEADLLLAGRGIPVVPDVMANLATNAWWWWTLFGDIEPTVAAAFAQVDGTMEDLVGEVFARAPENTPLRATAETMADERAAAAAAQEGTR
ncbi:MAG: Glu/Leu/Phe/Val dehydrogenase dimerization domain-containing protein [Solirubrobacteraceae bacterium]